MMYNCSVFMHASMSYQCINMKMNACKDKQIFHCSENFHTETMEPQFY